MASWERVEENEAELRYERFMMLQSLAKRMKRFYKHDYSLRDTNTFIEKFKHASFKQQNLANATPSHLLSEGSKSAITQIRESQLLDLKESDSERYSDRVLDSNARSKEQRSPYYEINTSSNLSSKSSPTLTNKKRKKMSITLEPNFEDSPVGSHQRSHVIDITNAS